MDVSLLFGIGKLRCSRNAFHFDSTNDVNTVDIQI